MNQLKLITLVSLGLASVVGLSACNLNFGSGLKKTVICREGKFYGNEPSGIIGGELFNENSRVARQTFLLIHSSPTTGSSICTATLIEKDIVLTAAHCVDGAENNPERVAAVFSTQPNCESRESGEAIAKKSIVAQDVWIHPYYGSGASEMEYDKQGRFEKNDLALVLLSKQAPSGYAVTEMLKNSKGLARKENVLIAGYGSTVGGRKADRRSLELRGIWRKTPDKAGMNEITDAFKKYHSKTYSDSVVKKMLSESFNEKNNELFTWIDQRDGKGACFGDSGGPVFVYREGQLLQVGVASEELSNGVAANVCLTSSRYINIAPQLAWLYRGIAFLRNEPSRD